MKRIFSAGFVTPAVSLLILGSAVAAYGQKEQEKEAKPAKPQQEQKQQAKPARQEPQRAQHPQKQQQQTKPVQQEPQRAQHEQKQQAKPVQQHEPQRAQQEQKQPAKPQRAQHEQKQPAKPAQQEPQRAQHEQKQQAKPVQQHEPQRAQHEQKQQAKPARQQARAGNSVPQRSRQEARGWQQQRGWLHQGGGWQGNDSWQRGRATQWQAQHRTWGERGGYGGYYIPDATFALSFGNDHWFRIASQPTIVGGYPRFQHDGFWFMLVDPWPETWGQDWYATDDVYVGYDNGYYLYNRRDPGDGIAVSIVL